MVESVVELLWEYAYLVVWFRSYNSSAYNNRAKYITHFMRTKYNRKNDYSSINIYKLVKNRFFMVINWQIWLLVLLTHGIITLISQQIVFGYLQICVCTLSPIAHWNLPYWHIRRDVHTLYSLYMIYPWNPNLYHISNNDVDL
jgi:hypothetical protein